MSDGERNLGYSRNAPALARDNGDRLPGGV
jgi:hypothetical protein